MLLKNRAGWCDPWFIRASFEWTTFLSPKKLCSFSRCIMTQQLRGSPPNIQVVFHLLPRRFFRTASFEVRIIFWWRWGLGVVGCKCTWSLTNFCWHVDLCCAGVDAFVWLSRGSRALSYIVAVCTPRCAARWILWKWSSGFRGGINFNEDRNLTL